MASTQIVYQGLQTCLEPQFNDQNLPNSPKIQEPNNGGGVKKKNVSGWSFLEALENPSMASKNLEEAHVVYVHPMVKRSSSALSSKSLEMCTEGLGSESGSDVSESGDEFCSISMEERERFRAVRMSRCCRSFDRKTRGGSGGSGGFPPPLTSISGSDGTVKVRHHREGGRLVIKAVSVSNGGTNFKTERTNGRLKLSLLKDCSVNYESGRAGDESCLLKEDCSVIDGSERVEDENYEEGGSSEGSGERVKDESWLLKDSFGNDESERVEDENYEEGGDVESPEYSSSDGDVAVAEGEEDGGDWRWKVGCSAGKGELKRLTRCKEGGNGNKVFATLCSSWVS
ncbi:hypothetical protein OSB04_022922 [Centaurea solstitialis]|uniref:FAF domain-containing protein n=1 Tax=Centaurea solstitialis TaxID=347529 RepID=A0AA38W8X3_9ASTR|nr:hypothetical protein OSB04_022922 [Centaurea solstitialis]